MAVLIKKYIGSLPMFRHSVSEEQERQQTALVQLASVMKYTLIMLLAMGLTALLAYFDINIFG